MRTLTAIVLGVGVLGAGCGAETKDYVSEGAAWYAQEQGWKYVSEVYSHRGSQLQGKCEREIFPEFNETRALSVIGINENGKTDIMNICCILERREYQSGFFALGTGETISAGYCVKMSQPSEAQ